MKLCRLLVRLDPLRLAMWVGTMGVAWFATGPVALARAEPPWARMRYTLFREIQAVEPDGSGAWNMPTWSPHEEQGYKLQGVVLNNPADMLDSRPQFIASGPDTRGKAGAQWQVFIQFHDDPAISDDDQDFGGAAIWMGQNYGNLWFRYGADEFSYRDDEWTAEVARVSLKETLKAGDLIEVRARGGWFQGGKQNVTEQHDNAKATDFDVIRLGHVGLPEPTLITFADIKGDDDRFRFVADRSEGAEHFQATLVRLEGVRLMPGGAWKPDGVVTLTDDPAKPTYTLAMKLGRNPGFNRVPRPSGAFDVVGIFDQEGADFQAGYRLWVMDPGKIRPVAFAPKSAGLPPLFGVMTVVAMCLSRPRRKRRSWGRGPGLVGRQPLTRQSVREPRAASKKRAGLTLVELLVVIAIVVLLLTLLVTGILMVREASRRMSCASHLKQIGLALHNYHGSHRCFPPGNLIRHAGICPEPHDLGTSEDRRNWLIAILPYVEQKSLYDRYDDRAVNEAPSNQAVRETWVATYVCPSDRDNEELAVPANGPAGAWTLGVAYMPGSYRAMSGRSEGLRFLDSNAFATYPNRWRGAIHTVGAKGFATESFMTIRDGASNTWLVGESTTRSEHNWRTFWAYSYAHYTLSAATPESRILLGDYEECVELGGVGKSDPCRRGWGSYHSNGLNFLLCDGSVRFICTSIDMELFAELATIDGAETVRVP